MSLTGHQDSSAEQSISQRIVMAVSEASGVAPTSLDPLYHAIDPDALESLFQADATGRIEFRYEDHAVVVHGDGRVTVSGP